MSIEEWKWRPCSVSSHEADSLKNKHALRALCTVMQPGMERLAEATNPQRLSADEFAASVAVRKAEILAEREPP